MEILLARRAGNSTQLNRYWVSLAWSVSLLLAISCAAQQPDRGQVQPYFRLRSHQTQYAGPADRQTDFQQVSEVRIGYFGPSDPLDRTAGQMWRGASLAIAEANREGGFHGKPFRLVPVWSENPWGTGVKLLMRLVYKDQVWAIIGGVDGASTHLAEQVVAKARLPLVSPVSTDKTVNLANVPWMFSLAPRDDLIAAVLAPRVVQATGTGKFVLISANDHDSHLLTREVRKQLTRLKAMPALQFEFEAGTEHLDDLVRASLACDPQVVVTVANADESLQLVGSLRQHGFRGLIVGGPEFARSRFLREVDTSRGPLSYPLLEEISRCESSHEGTSTSDALTVQQLPAPQEPLPADFDVTARQTYDAVRLTVAAIRKAGLSRTEIGKALRELSPCCGLAGRIEWDRLGSNIRQPSVVTLADRQP